MAIGGLSGNTSQKYPKKRPNVKRIGGRKAFNKTKAMRPRPDKPRLEQSLIHYQNDGLEPAEDAIVDIWFKVRAHSATLEAFAREITTSDPIAKKMAMAHLRRYWATESAATTKSWLSALKRSTSAKNLEKNRLPNGIWHRS